ncbi:MAG: DNA-formamidopyrimidine glycosylase family protein [Rhodospirillaceae bacterium]
MPELPDIDVYIEALEARIGGARLDGLRLRSPFLLRTVHPKPQEAVGHDVTELRRVGKRIAIGFDNDIRFVLHLMIAGRLHWKEPGAKIASKSDLAAFDFPDGTLTLTEAGTKKRAALHVVAGEEGLAGLDPGGLEIFDADLAAFRDRLTASNHTAKRALTDPHIFSGIGNAYSDEILHRAKMSPVLLTQKMTEAEIERLFDAVRSTLADWTRRLRADAGDGFPEKVTVFRKGMAVHGRYGEPCPVCGAPVQRIRHADNETDYCAGCQTGGRLLADRSLSRLLKADWPKTLTELEERSVAARAPDTRSQGRKDTE